MRLTLRTLLAYRDGVLSPAETSDLHQRIKQTEVASNLLRRIEAQVQRKQLLAPKVNGTGLAGDANTVAEYLDDTLASDQVPEFERICIMESDSQLAELAHCHQILAAALHAPVSVPSHLKQTVIGLSDSKNRLAFSKRLKNTSSGTVIAELVSDQGAIQRTDDTHDAQPVSSIDTSASSLQADFADSNGKSLVGKDITERSQVQAPMVTSGGGSIKPQGLDLEQPQLAHEVPEYLVGQAGGSWRIPLAIGAMLALLAVLVWQALGPLKNVQELFVASNASKDNANNSRERTTDIGSDLLAPEASQPVETKLDKAAASPTVPEPSQTVPSADASNAEATTSSDRESSVVAEKPTQPVAPDVATAPQVEPVRNLLVWTPTNKDDLHSVVLARNVADDGAVSVNRYGSDSAIPFESQIVVPPAMRPTLNLAGRCFWTVCGPSLMQSKLNGETGEIAVTTSLCRALTKAGRNGAKLTVSAPGCSVVVEFGSAASMASIEVCHRPVTHGPLNRQTSI